MSCLTSYFCSFHSNAYWATLKTEMHVARRLLLNEFHFYIRLVFLHRQKGVL